MRVREVISRCRTRRHLSATGRTSSLLIVNPNVSFNAEPYVGGESAGDFVRRCLNDPRVERLTIISAWFTNGGLGAMRAELSDFRARGGKLRTIVGLDSGGATEDGLRLALEASDEAFVFHDPSGGIFHSKLYLAEGAGHAELCVGSPNATQNGFFVNDESLITVEFAIPDESAHTALLNAREYYDQLRAETELCLSLSNELIDKMLRDPALQIRKHGDEQYGNSAGVGNERSGGRTGSEFFGKRLAERRRAGPPSRTSQGQTSSAGSDLAKGAGGVLEGGSGVATRRWFKPLSRADAQQLPRNSSKSAMVTLVKSHHEIEPSQYFRHEFFANADWVQSDGKETASIIFEIVVDAKAIDTRPLTVVFDPRLASEQNNRTVLLRWGPELNAYFRSVDRTDAILTLESFDGERFRLTISDEPIGSFRY